MLSIPYSVPSSRGRGKAWVAMVALYATVLLNKRAPPKSFAQVIGWILETCNETCYVAGALALSGLQVHTGCDLRYHG